MTASSITVVKKDIEEKLQYVVDGLKAHKVFVESYAPAIAKELEQRVEDDRVYREKLKEDRDLMWRHIEDTYLPKLLKDNPNIIDKWYFPLKKYRDSTFDQREPFMETRTVTRGWFFKREVEVKVLDKEALSAYQNKRIIKELVEDLRRGYEYLTECRTQTFGDGTYQSYLSSIFQGIQMPEGIPELVGYVPQAIKNPKGLNYPYTYLALSSKYPHLNGRVVTRASYRFYASVSAIKNYEEVLALPPEALIHWANYEWHRIERDYNIISEVGYERLSEYNKHECGETKED